MRLDCANLERIAHSISLVQECDVVRNGALRLSTPFVYPNGSNIDIFLGHGESLFGGLRSLRFRYDRTLFRERTGENGIHRSPQGVVWRTFVQELGVKFENGVFRIFLDRDQIADISDAVFRLSQACVRVSDFATHQRLRSANPFRDDVEDFLEASGLHPKPDAKVRGPYGSDIKLDFEVQRSFVLVLAAMNEPAAHSSANEIFAKLARFENFREVINHSVNSSPSTTPNLQLFGRPIFRGWAITQLASPTLNRHSSW